MKKKLSLYIIISFFIGSCIYICEKQGWWLPNWVRFYVNDFLIVPIVLFIGLKTVQIARNDTQVRLSLMLILWICFLYSFLFEFIFPMSLKRYTADKIDVLLYFLSGLLFYQLQKGMEAKHKTNPIKKPTKLL